jgi:hypothetical protein
MKGKDNRDLNDIDIEELKGNHELMEVLEELNNLPENQ